MHLIDFKKIKKFYNTSDEARWGSQNLPEHKKLISQLIESFTEKEDIVIELGCGKGALKNIYPKYVGIDISYLALKKYMRGKRCIQANIEEIPLKHDCASFIFSRAVLEHVPNPEKVFTEIDRVLQKGGAAYLAPAWFCRPWAAKGLPIKKYSELGWLDKLKKFLIPLRNHILWRSMFVIPKRIFREFLYLLLRKPMPFKYKRLSPNLKEYIYTVCDAFASMDPHMAIIYFRSRGYEILNGANKILKRLFYRHQPVIISKK